MSKTTKTTPGLRRLRASPKAETIRAAVLTDQRKGRASALAPPLPRIFPLGRPITSPPSHHKITAAKAPKTAAGAPSRSPRLASSSQCRKGRQQGHQAAIGKRASMLASAQAGKLPAPPDFAAETHRRFRPRLSDVVELVKAGDVEALKAYQYPGFVGSSVKAIMRYRDLALIALEAKRA